VFRKPTVLIGASDGRAGRPLDDSPIALARRLADSPVTLVLANVCAGAGLVRPGAGIALADERAHAHRLLTNARLDSALSAGTIVPPGTVRRDGGCTSSLSTSVPTCWWSALRIARGSVGCCWRERPARLSTRGTVARVSNDTSAVAADSVRLRVDWTYRSHPVNDGSPRDLAHDTPDAARRLARRLEATIRVLGGGLHLQPLPAWWRPEPLD